MQHLRQFCVSGPVGVGVPPTPPTQISWQTFWLGFTQPKADICTSILRLGEVTTPVKNAFSTKIASEEKIYLGRTLDVLYRLTLKSTLAFWDSCHPIVWSSWILPPLAILKLKQSLGIWKGLVIKGNRITAVLKCESTLFFKSDSNIVRKGHASHIHLLLNEA